MPRIETATQRQRRLALAKLKRMERIANETPLQRQIRLENRRQWRFDRILNEPLEDRFFRQYIDKIQQQDRREGETPEQRAARIEKCRLRASERKTKSQVCSFCKKRFFPNEVIKYNRIKPQTTFLLEIQGFKDEFTLCYQCNDHIIPPKSSSPYQPSCSSRAESVPIPMEPESQTLLEIKNEVLWEEQNGGSEENERNSPDNPLPEQTRREGHVSAALEQIRGEISELAREDALSAAFQQIREEIKELARGDEFDAFGRYVASLLRNMRPRRAQQAQPLIINLLAAEMIKNDDDETESIQ